MVRFYRAFAAARCEPSHISLFRRETGVGDPRAHLLAQDLVYVGGGSLVSLLGTWRAHGFDALLREAWRAGVVLCGGSAGSLCWFAHARQRVPRGAARRIEALGLLPWSNAVHYDEESGRRGAFLDAVADGLPPGYGVGDGAALHFVGHRAGRSRVLARGAARVVVGRDGAGVRRAGAARPLPGRRRRAGRAGRARGVDAATGSAIIGRVTSRPADRRILAMGGGGFTMRERNPALDRWS